MKSRLVLGTRGSALALAQADLTTRALRARHPELEIAVEKIVTGGDLRSAGQATEVESGAGIKGLFTREIERELLSGRIDAAVHSLKDLPGRLSPEFVIAAVLERAITGDFLLAKSATPLLGLPAGAIVATGSVRRKEQILWRRPDLRVEDLRGNVPTRLRKLKESKSFDAIVLAGAGLERLGYRPAEGKVEFEGEEFFAEDLSEALFPAIGQGAIGIECRADDQPARALLAGINHAESALGIRAERELLRLLDGDCDLPVGARTRLEGTRMRMEAIVFGAPGEAPLEASAEGAADEPEQLAKLLFHQLYARNE